MSGAKKRMRDIVKIDREKCTGCGLCVNACHEGALALVDGKAVLISESMCDGLGACLPTCPAGAIRVVKEEAAPYDEKRVLVDMVKLGKNVVAAHLQHLLDHEQTTYFNQALEYLTEHESELGFDPMSCVDELKDNKHNQGAGAGAGAAGGCGCGGGCGGGDGGECGGDCGSCSSGCGGKSPAPFATAAPAPVVQTPPPAQQPQQQQKPLGCGCPGSMARSFAPAVADGNAPRSAAGGDQPSALSHWPIQLHLINPSAPHFRESNILISADCVAFSLGAFHSKLLRGKTLVIACPKLDSNKEEYQSKITALIDEALVDTITVARMEVPCCGGLVQIVQAAKAASKRNVPVKVITVSCQGQIIDSKWL